MQRVMQNNAAVFRTQETLEEGIYGQTALFGLDMTQLCFVDTLPLFSHTIFFGTLVRL